MKPISHLRRKGCPGTKASLEEAEEVEARLQHRGGGTGTAATGGGDGTGGPAISTVLASSSMPKTIVPAELANELRNRCQIEPNFIDALRS